MKFELRERDRRALLLLGIGIAVYFLISALILPAWDRLSVGADAVTKKEDELRKYRRAVVSAQNYSRLLDQAKKSVADAEGRLIRGDNASLASVELQTLVEGAAAKFNIPLTQRNMSSAKKKDDYFNEITMTLSFESTPNQVTSFLGELRAAPKFVTVRSFQLSPVNPAQEAPTKGELKKTVRVNVTVAALLSSVPKEKG